jgi:hypothetical protein
MVDRVESATSNLGWGTEFNDLVLHVVMWNFFQTCRHTEIW